MPRRGWRRPNGTSATRSRSNCRILQNRRPPRRPEMPSSSSRWEALEQWITGMKGPGETSINIYRGAVRKIQRWASRVGVVYVSDVTPALLDQWRGSWAPDAGDRENRLSRTTQTALLTRIKAFFRWATAMEYTKRNPALMLEAITPDDSQTWPLTPEQFDELLAATYRLDTEARYKSVKVGRHLRALFLVQRWTGLRVGDVLILPKSALQGNRLSAVMRKKRNRKPAASRIECVLPDHVVEALNSLPLRTEEHPDYFFWSRTCTEEINVNKWLRKVDRLNDYLSFKAETGEPMEFNSHGLHRVHRQRSRVGDARPCQRHNEPDLHRPDHRDAQHHGNLCADGLVCGEFGDLLRGCQLPSNNVYAGGFSDHLDLRLRGRAHCNRISGHAAGAEHSHGCSHLL